jgi:hypothetical protein
MQFLCIYITKSDSDSDRPEAMICVSRAIVLVIQSLDLCHNLNIIQNEAIENGLKSADIHIAGLIFGPPVMLDFTLVLEINRAI